MRQFHFQNLPGLKFLILSIALISVLPGCKKNDDSPPPGVGYESVTIGNQVWMVKNLDVVTYRNGDSIPLITDSLEWQSTTAGGYCNYNNDEGLVSTYGRIYNWHAVNDSRKLAPKGWHIATSAEWAALVNYLGGIDNAGGKLKEAGLEHWIAPNAEANNESGFTALPGGFRSETDGGFSNMGAYGTWWLSSGSSDDYARSTALTTITGKAYTSENLRNFGAYVRCIKD